MGGLESREILTLGTAGRNSRENRNRRGEIRGSHDRDSYCSVWTSLYCSKHPLAKRGCV